MFVFAFSDYARLKHWHINWFGIESQMVPTPERDGGWVPPLLPGDNPVEMPKDWNQVEVSKRAA
jgi:hypothetical protein